MAEGCGGHCAAPERRKGFIFQGKGWLALRLCGALFGNGGRSAGATNGPARAICGRPFEEEEQGSEQRFGEQEM